MADDNPLLKALPPATDYLTYLTIIEYNLTPERLPTLHDVLQDATLTTNIGWDLIHILVPLLPDSEQCLQDIARLGNPREVIIKVTESLRLIDFNNVEEDVDEEDAQATPVHADASHPIKTAPVQSHGEGASESVTQAVEAPPELPLPVLQFIALLSMLSVLHPRIKTKYPSRFLSTTLQAILASYSEASTHMEELTSAVVKFVKALSGSKRPQLPPRRSSSQFNVLVKQQSAPDPEAHAESPAPGEARMQKRLLQSFVTHILEHYMLSLSSSHDVPGLAWCSRLQEKVHPERTVPRKASFADMFANEENLQVRSSIVGQVEALARDLAIDSRDLLACIIDRKPEPVGDSNREDEPPISAEEIPLSKSGSLFLFAAREIRDSLYDSPGDAPDFYIFPEHDQILQTFINSPAAIDVGTIGSEPAALVDAILALGLLALENDQIGEPAEDETFTRYLQTISLLSANTQSPTLRYHAHYLTSTILRSHPSDNVRLAFIRDTLEHCPFENLKVSAVGWIKGETIEANPPSPHPRQADDEDQSVFNTPLALATLSPFLFPDLTHDLSAPSLAESWTTLKLNLSFYLATLNFYYLLLTATHMHEPLDIGGLHTSADIGGSFLGPLVQASKRFRAGLQHGGELADEEGEEGVRASVADLEILDDALERVTEGVAALNQE
ncbi:hypothetical protein LTR04_001355 [Oleoguttula sp. CCFEE 6159]|nr:hypothetical protein LTR04_001355 [Oleoguttula sp. CCFEE 6159]